MSHKSDQEVSHGQHWKIIFFYYKCTPLVRYHIEPSENLQQILVLTSIEISPSSLHRNNYTPLFIFYFMFTIFL